MYLIIETNRGFLAFPWTEETSRTFQSVCVVEERFSPQHRFTPSDSQVIPMTFVPSINHLKADEESKKPTPVPDNYMKSYEAGMPSLGTL